MALYFIPLYILGGLLLLFGIFALLGRWRGGKYLKPVVVGLTKVPFLDRYIKKASRAALERQNPELASAIRKLERKGATKDPMAAQKAISSLTADERRAYLAAAGAEGGPEPQNRAERRRMEKARRTGR
jgi:hypothetical protein